MANLREIIPAFFTGPNGEPLTQDQIKQRQAVAQSLLQQATDTSPNAGGWASVLAKGVQGGVAGYKNRQADKATAANTEYDAGLLGSLFSGQAPASATPAYPSSVAGGGSSMSGDALNVSPEIKAGIAQSASALGIDPVDLATAISYETGGTFNPTQAGPTTKWGQHKGFIQFGEPQAQQYGVDWNNPVGSQLGENGAVVNYLRDRGVKPGMGMLDIYSTINAGAPGLYNRSDTAAGGAPGTVADKVRDQMQGHRAKARSLFKAALEGTPVAGVQVAGGSDADMANVAALPAAPNPNPTVAEALAFTPEQRARGNTANSPSMIPAPGATPYSGPGAQVTPALEWDGSAKPNPDGTFPDMTSSTPVSLPGADQGIGGVAYEQFPPITTPVGIAGVPAGSGGTPVIDFTSQPGMSVAADLPFDNSLVPGNMGNVIPPQNNPVASALTAPQQTPVSATAPATPSVAEALAIRAQADPNDRMVADASQTLQPTAQELQGVFPAAPQAPQPVDQSMQLQRVIADPRASPQTKQVALSLLQRQQTVADRQAAAQVEQQNWFAQKQYEQDQQANDPLRQEQIRKARLEADALQNPQPKFNMLAPEEIQQLGLDPKKQYQRGADGRITAIGDSGVNVQVHTGENTNDFKKKADEKAAERFDGYILGGRQASQQISDMQTLVDLGKQISTGKGAQALLLLGPYAEMAGVKIDGLGPAQAYKSITDRLAPAMRVPGSGSSSDIDVRMFLNSLPNVGNSPEANAVINGTFQSIAQNKQQAADLALRATNGEMTWQEAEKQISALPNPYDNFKKFKRDNPSMFGGDLTDTPTSTTAPAPASSGGYRVIGVK